LAGFETAFLRNGGGHVRDFGAWLAELRLPRMDTQRCLLVAYWLVAVSVAVALLFMFFAVSSFRRARSL
jgi:hypothetical protein